MSMWTPDVIRIHDDSAGRLLSVMGSTGFIGSRYCAMYPEQAYPEPSRMVMPLCRDVLMLRSTTDNYGPLRGDLRTDIEVNLLHLTSVLEHVVGKRDMGFTRGVSYTPTFTFVSSWFTVANAGQSVDHPAREDDPCDPNGLYAITKSAAEKVTRSLCQTWGIPYRILRLGNVLGIDPRASKTKNALVHLLAKVKAGEDVTIYTGDNYRDVMHVDDTCRAIHLCLEQGALDTVYHVGYGSSVRTIDLVEHAKGVTGSRSKVALVPPPRFHQIVQVPDFHFDTTKLRGLGFRPTMTPFEAVERVVAEL